VTTILGSVSPGYGNDPASVIAGMNPGDVWDGQTGTYPTVGLECPSGITIQGSPILVSTGIDVNGVCSSAGSTSLTYSGGLPTYTEPITGTVLPLTVGMNVAGAGISTPGTSTVTIQSIIGNTVNLVASGSATIVGLTGSTSYNFNTNAVPIIQAVNILGTPSTPITIAGSPTLVGTWPVTTFFATMVGQAGIGLKSCTSVYITGNVTTWNTCGDGITLGNSAGNGNCSDIQITGSLTVNNAGRYCLGLCNVDGLSSYNTWQNVTCNGGLHGILSDENDEGAETLGMGSITINMTGYPLGSTGLNLISALTGPVVINVLPGGLQGSCNLNDPLDMYTVTINLNGHTWTMPSHLGSVANFNMSGGTVIVNNGVCARSSGTVNLPVWTLVGATPTPNITAIENDIADCTVFNGVDHTLTCTLGTVTTIAATSGSSGTTMNAVSTTGVSIGMQANGHGVNGANVINVTPTTVTIDSGSFTTGDGYTFASTTLTATSGTFSGTDLDRTVLNANIPSDTQIASITDSTHAVMTNAPTTGGTGQSVVLPSSIAVNNAAVPYTTVGGSFPTTAVGSIVSLPVASTSSYDEVFINGKGVIAVQTTGGGVAVFEYTSSAGGTAFSGMSLVSGSGSIAAGAMIGCLVSVDTHSPTGTATYTYLSASGIHPASSYLNQATLVSGSGSLSGSGDTSEISVAGVEVGATLQLTNFTPLQLTGGESVDGLSEVILGSSTGYLSGIRGMGARGQFARGYGVGSSLVAGSAGGTASLTGTAAGVVVLPGSGAGSAALSGSAVGVVSASGTGTGSASLVGSASGAVVVGGVASGSLSLTGVASATLNVPSVGTSTATLTGSAIGAVSIVASGSAVASITGAASGTISVDGSGSGSIALSGAATAVVSVPASAAGTLGLTGLAAGSVNGTQAGSGASTATLSGTAVATVGLAVSASAEVALSGSGVGQVVLNEAATGQLALTGTAVATVTGIPAAPGTVTASDFSANSVTAMDFAADSVTAEDS
jgi:hypothetical protein